MEKQLAFADIEGSSRGRTTKREALLRETGGAAPRAEPLALVEPSCHDGKRGRPPVALERAMRMYSLQIRPGLSDEGGGDACYDSRAFSDFLGVSFDGRDQVPDATTLLRSEPVVEDNGLGRAAPGEADWVLKTKGAATRGGRSWTRPSSTRRPLEGGAARGHAAREGAGASRALRRSPSKPKKSNGEVAGAGATSFCSASLGDVFPC